MSECVLFRCQQEKKLIKREFQKWNKNLLLQLGLETICKNYFSFDITRLEDKIINEPIDFNSDSGCLFCVSRQEHSIKIAPSKNVCKTNVKQETFAEHRRLVDHDPSTEDPVCPSLGDEPLDLSLKHTLSSDYMLSKNLTSDKRAFLDFKSDIKKLYTQEELDRVLNYIASEKIDFSRPSQFQNSLSNRKTIETLFSSPYSSSDDPLLSFLSAKPSTDALLTPSPLYDVEPSKNDGTNTFFPSQMKKNDDNLHPSVIKLVKKMAVERLVQEIDFLRSNSQSTNISSSSSLSYLNDIHPYITLSSSSLSLSPITVRASESCSALTTTTKNNSSNRHLYSNIQQTEKISSLLNDVMVHVLQQMFEQNKQNVDIENLKSKSKFKNSEPLFVKKKNGAKTTTTVSSSMPQIAKKSLDDGKSSNGKYVHSQPILNNLLSSKLNRIPLPVNNFIRKTIIQSKSKRLIDDQQQPQSTKRMKLQDDNRTMSDRQSPSSSSSSSCSSLSLSCKSTKSRSSNSISSLSSRSKIIIGNDGRQIRPKRGQYRRYESEQLAKAVAAVLSNEMSVHKAGSYFGVPHSTLEYKVKERNSKTRNKTTDISSSTDCSQSCTGLSANNQLNDGEQKSSSSNFVSSSFGNRGIISSQLSKLFSNSSTTSKQKFSSNNRLDNASNDTFQDQGSPSSFKSNAITSEISLSDHVFPSTKLKQFSPPNTNEALEQTPINDKNNNETKIAAANDDLQS